MKPGKKPVIIGTEDSNETDRRKERQMYGENTILVVGQAKPSREDAIFSLHGEFYVSFVVDRNEGTILDLECNTILSVTRNFVASMFLGKSIKTDLEEMERMIRERYFALTQKPLIACLKDAHNRYMVVTGQKEKKA